jgi:hypothetical protein
VAKHHGGQMPWLAEMKEHEEEDEDEDDEEEGRGRGG